jgi:SAM-dependent methyltransferase
MSRWSDIAGDDRGRWFAERFERLAAQGRDTHGEATFCARRVPVGARVLDAGCGTGRVAIRLAELGYRCVGVDVDPVMLAEARRSAPHLDWVQADLARYAAPDDRFDLVVAAGNVLPFVDRGTEPAVVLRMAATLVEGGLLVAGFGLDSAHLPLPAAPFTLDDYDRWCADAGLELLERYATWDEAAYADGGYAVSVHRR